MIETLTKARSFVDDRARLVALMDRLAPRLQARFLAVVKAIKDSVTLDVLEELLAAGRVEDALIVSETAMLQMGRGWAASFITAGDETAKVIAGALGVMVDFDSLNEHALQAMRENKLRLVREFTSKQRLASREALEEGIARGLNPRDQARAFRDSIGLTRRQVRAVSNYRDMLTRLDRDALRRKLRDRRFDRVVDKAIREGKPLTDKQIDNMVARYRSRYLTYRSETIARTEALRSVHAGTDEMYSQAIRSGTLDASALTQTWKTASDGNRVRRSHRAMHNQRQPVGRAFISGNGNLLRYPGDPDAPANDTVDCRCAKTTTYREIS